jgi:hypothetical protein
MAYTEEQRRTARQELARREIARRQQANPQQAEEEEDIPYTPPPKRTGWESIGEDIGELPGKALDYAMDLQNQIGQSGGQVYNKPGRALKNLLAGVGELGIGTLNFPHEAIKYLGEKNVIPEGLKKYNELPFTHIPDLGIEKAMGLNKAHEGDQFLRQLPGLIAGGKALRSIPGVKGSGKKIAAQFQHGPLKRKVEALEKQHEVATGEHTAATGEYNALKDFLESQAGFETSNPNALTRKATEAQQALKGLQEQSAAVPEALRATEEPVAPQKTPLSLVEPVRAGEKPEISEEPIRQAESLLKTNAQKSDEHEAAISQHLGEGNAHRKRVAEKLNPILEERQAEIGKGYDKYINGLKDKQVTLTNPREAKAITQDIHKLLKEGDTSSKEMIRLTDELANLGKGETMPADKFVSAYRSLRGMAQKTRSSAYGKSPQEFDRLIEAADSMDADVGRMKKIIDSGLGEDNLEELGKLNHRYATEVAPLFKNKFFQHMQANNKAPTNMIEQLTNEPYIKSTNPNKVTGTQILNEIIKADPELLQNVVGERFAHKPESLHQWDEAAHSFIQHMPELQELRGKHFEAKQAEAQSKLDLDRVKQEHQMQREQVDAVHRKEIQKASEQTRAKKAEVHKENVAKDEEHKAKAKYYKMQQEMKALDERHTKLTDSAKKMKEKSRRKNISLKEKLDIEHQLSQTKKQLGAIEKDRARLKKTGKVIGGTAVTLAVGAPIYKKAKSIVELGD